MQPLLLARELKIAAEVAMSILKSLKVSPSSNNDTGAVTSSSSSYTTLSAFQLSNLHTGEKYVITFCKAIDIMLGGGIPIGQITEFVGVPAIGKTQMCIQIALNVQLPQVRIYDQVVWTIFDTMYHRMNFHISGDQRS